MAACPPGSLDGEYLRQLGEVRIWFIEEGNLNLNPGYDTETMKFVR